MRPTPARLRDRLPGTIAGIIERVRIGATGALWQLLGFADRSREAETYLGIGITARPPAGSGAAIVAYPDGTQSPVVIAASDPENAFAVQADESALHNTQAVVYVKADGSVEIRSRSGVAVALATKADLDAAVNAYNVHQHTVNGASPPTVLAPSPVGTTVLKGQ